MESTILKAGNGSEAISAAAVPPKKTRQTIQAAYFGLLWAHGKNLPNFAQYAELLAGVGLEPSDVDAAIHERAMRQFRERLDGQVASVAVGSLRSGQSFKMLPGSTIVGGTVIAVGTDDVKVDAERLGGKRSLERWSLQAPVVPVRLPSPPRNDITTGVEIHTTVEGAEAMKKITEKAARRMLAATGQAGADDWSTKKLLNKLNGLKEALENGAVEPEGEEDAATFKAVLKLLEQGKEVVLEEEQSAADGSDSSDEEKPTEKLENDDGAEKNDAAGKERRSGKGKKISKDSSGLNEVQLAMLKILGKNPDKEFLRKDLVDRGAKMGLATSGGRWLPNEAANYGDLAEKGLIEIRKESRKFMYKITKAGNKMLS